MWLNSCVEEAVFKCGERYGFSGEEAMRELFGEGVGAGVVEKSKKSKSKEKKVKASIPLPFNGEFDESRCFGLHTNHGLFTQCSLKRVGEKCYCIAHESQADKNSTGTPDNGTIQQRLASDLLNFTTPSGKPVTPYSKIMKKFNITVEQAQEEAGKVNVTIDSRHFMVADEEAKKGRPKKEKAPKEAKATKGRPKKEKMSVEISEPKEDLFATLVAQAAAESSGSESGSESEPESETEMSAMSAADKESHAAEKEVKKNEKKAEKEAKKAQEKAEKKALEDAAKAEKKAQEEAAKAEKKAKEEAAKAEKKAKEESAKAEKKAKEEAAKAEKKAKEEAAKAEKKAKEEAAKADKKTKEPSKKAPKKAAAKKEEPKPEPKPAEPVESSSESEDEEEEEEEETYDAAKVESKMPDVVNWFEFEGKKYLKSKNTGIVYSTTQEVVGKWNTTTNRIDFNEEEEEEDDSESSDSDSDGEECEEDNYEA